MKGHIYRDCPDNTQLFIIYFILLTVFTILLSAVTYKYIEKPGIIMGNKIIAARKED